jgi:hypothetical protein
MTLAARAEWERLFRAWMWHLWLLEGSDVDGALETVNQLEDPRAEALAWGEDLELSRCDTNWMPNDGKEEPR